MNLTVRLGSGCFAGRYAVLGKELLQKEDDYQSLKGFQARQYQRYLDGMRDALLEQLPSIGTYTGPWTSGKISREENEKYVV